MTEKEIQFLKLLDLLEITEKDLRGLQEKKSKLYSSMSYEEQLRMDQSITERLHKSITQIEQEISASSSGGNRE